MKPSLLQQLKQETLPYHESLERQLPLFRPDLSWGEYRTLLESFYGFYAPWEQRAVPPLQRVWPGFFDGRRKTPLLERDLQFLGSDPALLRTCLCLPGTDSLPALWGTLYVLEGATLGGQILTRHLTQHFSLSPEAGCSFFASYGAAVGDRWREFCHLLSSYSSPENDQAIVQAAIDTFSCFQAWLQQEVLLPC